MYQPPLDHAWIFAARLIVVDIVVIIFSRSFSGSWLEIDFEFGDTIVFYVFSASDSGGTRRYKERYVFRHLFLSRTRSTSNSFYIKLKWIPSPTSPPLKFPPITRVEVQEATPTALLRNPRPLRTPPTWREEAPVAMLTALLPKWRIILPISHHNCAFLSRLIFILLN